MGWKNPRAPKPFLNRRLKNDLTALMPALLNLGCGARYHPSWVNVDFVGAGKGVIGHNLRTGIPFEDEKFDAVYHSHLLEHFTKAQALPFLKECYRVTKKEGIIRVAVPDLERIAELYLKAIERVTAGDEEWEANYEWIKLELYDQVVREYSGGEMAAYLSQESIPNQGFVLGRIGVEEQRIIKRAEQSRNAAPAEPARAPVWKRLIYRLRQILNGPHAFREWTIQRALGSEYELLKLGRFRRGGEVHLWMYDRYSLSRLLLDAGFASPKRVDAAESNIPDWASYHLDTEPDGSIYKPGSLYMEATKYVARG